MEAAWVDRLERRFGFLAIPGLPAYVAGMTAVAGLLSSFKPEFAELLLLDPVKLFAGQGWRLLTFLIVPPIGSPLWLALWIVFLYSCLTALQSSWGDFKFTVFLAIGVVATALGAVALALTGQAVMIFDNSDIILAAFLAFARLLPDREILVMFVLPVKLRWLAAIAAVWIFVDFLTRGAAGRVQIAAGLLPYFVFFGAGHFEDARLAWRRLERRR